MNWKTFGAMLARDAHVARRNMIQLILQTFLQPLLFVFIFGRVMVGSGYMPKEYKSLLLPGIIAISMVFTGIWAVAMPLIAEFQWTREIEEIQIDRVRAVAEDEVGLAGGGRHLRRDLDGDGVGELRRRRGCGRRRRFREWILR